MSTRRIIEVEKYLLEVSRYLHLNPVRGVVLGQGTPIERRKRLREYRWSSYRGYAVLELARVTGKRVYDPMVGEWLASLGVVLDFNPDIGGRGRDSESVRAIWKNVQAVAVLG